MKWPYKLATLQENLDPSLERRAAAVDLARQIGSAVDDREAIVRDLKLDREFSIPSGNWDLELREDFVACYRMMATGEWSEVRYLRLRGQSYSGNSLIKMTISRGLRASDPIPDDFHLSWSPDAIRTYSKHWQALAAAVPARLRYSAPNMLGEVGWWEDKWLVNHDAISTQERINLLYSSRLLPERLDNGRILEIGGGYGALAHAISTLTSPSQYVICDLPESLMFAGLYLLLTQERPVRLLGVDDSLELRTKGEIVLVPNYLLPLKHRSQNFDVAINTLSMSEMTTPQVATYCRILVDCLGKKGVFFRTEPRQHAYRTR